MFEHRNLCSSDLPSHRFLLPSNSADLSGFTVAPAVGRSTEVLDVNQRSGLILGLQCACVCMIQKQQLWQGSSAARRAHTFCVHEAEPTAISCST